jgi:hypothetical protein
MFTTGSTWTTLIYMILMQPLGVLYFTLIVTLFSLAISLMGAPVIQYGFGESVIQPEVSVPFYAMPLVMALGGLLVVGTLHLARLVTALHGKFAKAMLVG